MQISSAHWLSAVTVEGDNWTPFSRRCQTPRGPRAKTEDKDEGPTTSCVYGRVPKYPVLMKCFESCWRAGLCLDTLRPIGSGHLSKNYRLFTDVLSSQRSLVPHSTRAGDARRAFEPSRDTERVYTFGMKANDKRTPPYPDLPPRGCCSCKWGRELMVRPAGTSSISSFLQPERGRGTPSLLFIARNPHPPPPRGQKLQPTLPSTTYRLLTPLNLIPCVIDCARAPQSRRPIPNAVILPIPIPRKRGYLSFDLLSVCRLALPVPRTGYHPALGRATVAERLDCSPPTKAKRVQSPRPVHYRIFRTWESYWTMSLAGGFSRGSPVSPHFHSGNAPYSPQSPSSALKTSLLRAAQIFSLTPTHLIMYHTTDYKTVTHFLALLIPACYRLAVEQGVSMKNCRPITTAGEKNRCLESASPSNGFAKCSRLCLRMAKKASCRIGIVRPRNSKPKGIRRLSAFCIYGLNPGFFVIADCLSDLRTIEEDEYWRSSVLDVICRHWRQVAYLDSEETKERKREGGGTSANELHASRQAIVIRSSRNAVCSEACESVTLGKGDSALNLAVYTDSLPDFDMWESCRTMPLVGGFSNGSPVSPAPCIPALLHTHLTSPSSAPKTSMVRATQISLLHSIPFNKFSIAKEN
ncbi:hypothetical protein PR048_010539 [Dryococelus australis]|uniref:Uncharacterized protein n=1 Tax=Dryococelus australis TaxID=614101 RepID=A0ABQ9I2Z2_9NEOP|nr:hypothetical protein PR048_010539 [Dryococelus australis]